ncbi:MAG: DUF3352 domain-containing protein, partial [Leptolyngbyaceae cyanobacterium SM1_1_3]|nr:DUF3352 domain-containing protein [Leptolyngbyaceae cyanobacterium SM1_1_3]
MKFRFFVSTLAAAAVTIFILGVGSWFVWVAQTPLTLLPGVEAAPEAALFIDKRSPVMVSLMVPPERLAELRQIFAAPQQRRQAAQDIKGLQAGLLSQTNLDYERDIQPWIGSEITFAVTSPDLDRDGENGVQPGYLLALASRDGEQARQFMQVFWQKRAIAGENLVFEQYAGVKLIYTAAQDQIAPGSSDLGNSLLASAVLGDRFVLFANSPTVLQQAINTAQANNLNLQQSPSYRRALEQLPERRFGLIYCDFRQLSDWLVGLPDMPAANRTQQSIDNLLVNLQLTTQGLIADTLLTAAAGQAFEPSQPMLLQPAAPLQHIPASAPFTAAGSHLSTLAAQIGNGFSGYSAVQQVAEPLLEQLRSQWNIDLPTILSSFGTGDYALAWLPGTEPSRSNWLFAIENDETTANYLAALDERARQQGLSVGTLQVGEQPVTAWARLSAGAKAAADALTLQADVVGLKATVDNQAILSTSTEGLQEALAVDDRSILKSADFKAAIAALKSQNDGYLYLDWPQVGPHLMQQSSQL